MTEKKYDDPLVASVRFSGELATIDFREPGLAARAYPLSSPDRLVVEIGRRAALPAVWPRPRRRASAIACSWMTTPPSRWRT